MTLLIVSGAIANKRGSGGEAWVRLSWALGLRRLGFDVVVLEQIAGKNLTWPAGSRRTLEDSDQGAYFAAVTNRFGLSARAALLLEDGEEVVGLPRPQLLSLAADSALLVNISGHLTAEPLFSGPAKRAYVDIDPGFTQFWESRGLLGNHLRRHELHFTIGENIGSPGCAIPTGGISWKHTRPPVLLEEWPVIAVPPPVRFTTVATWRAAHGPVAWGNRRYGLKVHEFRRFVDLPARVEAPFELALQIHREDVADERALARAGWKVVPAAAHCSEPDGYRRYLQRSGAEFSAAQGVYVHTRSGWFSDRTACYLASGKPVLVQDTGLAGHLPVGEGIVVFRTLDEAEAGARRIIEDYAGQAEAARQVAEEHFASDRVLGRFVEDAGLHP